MPNTSWIILNTLNCVQNTFKVAKMYGLYCADKKELQQCEFNLQRIEENHFTPHVSNACNARRWKANPCGDNFEGKQVHSRLHFSHFAFNSLAVYWKVFFLVFFSLKCKTGLVWLWAWLLLHFPNAIRCLFKRANVQCKEKVRNRHVTLLYGWISKSIWH